MRYVTFQEAQGPRHSVPLTIFPKVSVVATGLGSTLGSSASGCGYKVNDQMDNSWA